jgi:sister-chromatid-cohesion protein PDS5
MPTNAKAKSKAAKPVRTPKKKSRRNDDSDVEGELEVAPSSAAQRRSVRKSGAKSYAEHSDDEDEEMEKWQNNEEEEQSSASENEPDRAKDDSSNASDVNMDEADAGPGAEPGSEDELFANPKPIAKETRTRGGKKQNGTGLPSRSKEHSSPAVNGKAKPKANGKAAGKAVGNAVAKKPSGRATRAATKSVVPASSDDNLSDVPSD